MNLALDANDILLQTVNSKVVNSREVREVVEGTTCISDKKLSEIC